MGRRQTLRVAREVSGGFFLGAAPDEVFLPRKLAPEAVDLDAEIEVFVYADSEDRPVATTQRPKAEVGDFALLEVVDLSAHGAFLDWGLDKDLFAPFKLQQRTLAVGDRRVFAVALDERSNRPIAASQLRTFFDYDVSEVAVDDGVELLVYDHNSLGALVVVDQRHTGLVYRAESAKPLHVGDRLRGYVKAVRPDNKLDIRLTRTGKAAIDDATTTLLAALEAKGGYLPLHDKSPPAEIQRQLGLSKKAFKRAVGGLYKARRLALEAEGIRLIEG